MRYSIFIFCLILTFISSITNIMAQNPDSNKPLKITADDSLEWHRNERYFKAKKNVRASQGQTTLFSDILTAKYRDNKGGGMSIYIIQADGNVEIISPQSKAYGDKAIYNVDKAYAIMTGGNLRLISDDQNVTARDKFKYWINDQKLEAIGKAKAVRLGDTLEADKIIALFTKDKQGKQALKTLEAIGNVVITTPDEILTGDKAIYKTSTDIAQLIGNVKITRGPNIVNGEKAQVNLKTNISKIFGSNKESGRVRAIFHPNSETKPKNKSKDKPE